MIKRFLYSISLLFIGLCVCAAQDPSFETVKTELNRNFEVLKKQPIPAYYAFVRMDEIQGISTTANLGRLQSPATLNSPQRILTTCLRVGDHSLDNSHELRESGGGARGAQVTGNYLPFEENTQLLKNQIWLQLDELYKNGVQTYEQVKANIAVKVEKEDKSPDFSQEPVINYYEAPIAWKELNINPLLLEEKVRKYSVVFEENNEIMDGIAHFAANLSRKIFIDTEGREMAENEVSVRLILSAGVLADDGMFLPLYKSWTVFSLNELPSDEDVIATAKEMSQMLSDLKRAPVVESFTGPAILSPQAAGVFFHEIFGHRVEGSRLKQEMDAQTFKKKIGERVLPKHLSVTFDPTSRYYQNTALSGAYNFDDEGIMGQKVKVVDKGILKNFLMSRTPIEGFSQSNGHGRGVIGASPISRQSNMLVESTQRLSEDELIKRLRKEAKSQGKEYAYYFKDVAGGFTTTGRYIPNSFNVNPLVVYRIYTDGRPNELVRGVDLVGTPLAMFSQIEACGEEYAVFNGTCGAESGGVPVACVAPSLFVKQIETQKKPKGQSQPPLLPKPAGNKVNANLSQSDILLQAIKEETHRGLDNLKMDGLQAPFFISYIISETKQLSASASHGSLMNSGFDRSRSAGSRLLIGDYQCTDENFQGSAGGNSGYDGSPTLDNDVNAIRQTIWRDLDAIYKTAAELYEQKIATIKQLNIPEKDLELPDWDKEVPVVQIHLLPEKEMDWNKSRYEEYVKTASDVFNQYPEILESSFTVQLIEATSYFYNTEGTEFSYPVTFVFTYGTAFGKTTEGEDLRDYFSLIYAHPDELPSVEEMQARCKHLAEKLLEEINAPKMTESYSGPVLFEGLAVPEVFYSNFIRGDKSLIAERKPLTPSGFSYGGNRLEEMMDKRITAREISIEDLTGTPEYKGVKLLGYAPIDGQGVVPPAQLTLVENGILKTLLSDRIPTPKVLHSNGHSLAGAINTGVLRLSDTRTKSYQELKADLLKRAAEEKYEYAYIVREVAGGGSTPTKLYQINIADGSEKRIRSAAINNVSSEIFNKNIINISDKELIHNTFKSNPTTIITPDAILFEEMQIQSDRIDNFKKAPLVPRSQ